MAPFQVIIGPNGAGKSNLFDALRLLSKLAGSDLGSTFSELRGEANELFTLLPEGRSTDRMRLAVEMLVDSQIQPAIAPSAYRVELHEVYKDDETIDNLWVVEIVVPRPLTNTDLFFTGYNEAFVKTDAGRKKLSGPELQDEIRRRFTIR